jgi:hypothetical protein
MFCFSVQLGYVQYPHHARFSVRPRLKRMEAWGFVSKRALCQKTSRQKRRIAKQPGPG